MAINEDDRHDRAAATGTTDTRRKSWLPWVIGALLILGLILLLRSCGSDDRATTGETGDSMAAAPTAGTTTAGNTSTEAGAWNAEAFGTYLGSNEALGRSFALNRVTFDSGSVLLDEEARSEVAEVAAALKARPTARVSLRGYADPEGDAGANETLSAERTAAVRNALVRAGAGEDQVVAADAMGETGNAAVAANRRVEITVTAR